MILLYYVVPTLTVCVIFVFLYITYSIGYADGCRKGFEEGYFHKDKGKL